jgi:ribonuclease HIII
MLQFLYSCALSKADRNKIIEVSETVINEFQNSEKDAVKKYKNKLLQTSARIYEIAVAGSHEERKVAISVINLREENCFFSFHFDYDVKSHHSFKIGDIVTIQGIFKKFNKITATEYDYERRKINPHVKYWEEVEWSIFFFDSAEVVTQGTGNAEIPDTKSP